MPLNVTQVHSTDDLLFGPGAGCASILVILVRHTKLAKSVKILGIPSPQACWEIPFGEKNQLFSSQPLTMKKEAQYSVGLGIWDAQTSHSGILPQPTHQVTASSE